MWMVQRGQSLGQATVDWSLGVGLGEFSCVPGLTLSYDEYVEQDDAFEFSTLMEDSGLTWNRFVELLDTKRAHVPKPARFLAETAFLSLVADQRHTTPACVLSSAPRTHIPVNAFFEGNVEDVKRVIEAGHFERDTCIKVKIGRRPTSEERAVLDLLVRELGDHVALRLDGNRMMSTQEVASLLDGFPREQIDYLEEPLRDPTALPVLAKNLGVSIALDESLHEEETRDLRFSEGVKSWVVKPALAGGFSACQALDEQAQQAGKEIVLSSCFESPIGLAMQAQWAAALPAHKGPAGLATDRFFAQDVIPNGYDSRAGAIDIRAWRSLPDRAWLESIEGFTPYRSRTEHKRRRGIWGLEWVAKRRSTLRAPRRHAPLCALFRWVNARRVPPIVQAIDAGDVIAIDEPDAGRMLLVMLTIWQAGGVAWPLVPRDPKCLDPDRLNAGGVRWMWRGGKLESLRAKATEARLPEFASLIVSTSGSSGGPRLVVHNLHELEAMSELDPSLLPSSPRHDTPRWMLTLPPHHVGGLMIAMRCINNGWDLVVPDPSLSLLEALKAHEPSWISVVPTQLARLLDDHDGTRELAKCDGVLLGGGPSSSTLRRRAVELGIPLVVSYGSTETAGMIAATRDPARVVEATCAGEVHGNRRVVLSESGEIYVGGFGIALGVLEDGEIRDLCVPPRTPKDFALGGGLMPTGDIGEMRDGHLHVLGRRDRMFISGGENIHPESIERCLLDHPDVTACAVIDIPDEEFGARPIAFVMSSTDVGGDTLREHLRDHLPGFAVPDAFYAIPENAVGALKVLPTKLRAMFDDPKMRASLRSL